MKIGLILFLAKYYHRISIESINSFRYLLLPITVLISPVILVVLTRSRNIYINCSGGVMVVVSRS